jgi:hypothetical protein
LKPAVVAPLLLNGVPVPTGFPVNQFWFQLCSRIAGCILPDNLQFQKPCSRARENSRLRRVAAGVSGEELALRMP